jgi:hypothetical protein
MLFFAQRFSLLKAPFGHCIASGSNFFNLFFRRLRSYESFAVAA